MNFFKYFRDYFDGDSTTNKRIYRTIEEKIEIVKYA